MLPILILGFVLLSGGGSRTAAAPPPQPTPPQPQPGQSTGQVVADATTLVTVGVSLVESFKKFING